MDFSNSLWVRGYLLGIRIWESYDGDYYEIDGLRLLYLSFSWNVDMP